MGAAEIGEKQWENQIFVVTETSGRLYIYIAKGRRGEAKENERGEKERGGRKEKKHSRGG